MFVLETSICINVVILIKFYEINGKLWTILRLSLVSMLGYTHDIFDPIEIPSEQVTKLPPKLFMLFRVPLTHLDYWLAFFRKFPRHYTCSRTITLTWLLATSPNGELARRLIRWVLLPFYFGRCPLLSGRCSYYPEKNKQTNKHMMKNAWSQFIKGGEWALSYSPLLFPLWER